MPKKRKLPKKKRTERQWHTLLNGANWRARKYKKQRDNAIGAVKTLQDRAENFVTRICLAREILNGVSIHRLAEGERSRKIGDLPLPGSPEPIIVGSKNRTLKKTKKVKNA